MHYDRIVSSIKAYFLQLQKELCDCFEKEEGDAQRFIADDWKYSSGGGGKTCVLTDGAVIERGAVNFSQVSGLQLPQSASSRHPTLGNLPFEAMGISLIIHPLNPYVPAAHMNLRFIQLKRDGATQSHWWFGGGFDLTPFYGFEEDCQHWHRTAKLACDPFGKDLYAQYKKNCDEYFFIKHRNEPRGIGGLFFDDLNLWNIETCFQLIQSVGNHFKKAYLPLMQRRKSIPFGEKERQFQAYRRSRYVEFNLIYDRGTLFGLQSGGRVESILLSMPPQAHWQYNFQPQPGSKEAELTEKFLVARDWV